MNRATNLCHILNTVALLCFHLVFSGLYSGGTYCSAVPACKARGMGMLHA
jgi:hypothetical protein